MTRFNPKLSCIACAMVAILGTATTVDRADAQARRQSPSQVLGNGISISTGNAAGGTSVRASISARANRLQTSENSNRVRGYREYSNRFGDRGFLVEVYRY